MNDGLNADGETAGEKMGIGITAEQGGLKKNHAGVPDCGGATQQRQEHPGNHGLHPEQQRGAGEKRGNKRPGHKGRADVGQRAQQVERNSTRRENLDQGLTQIARIKILSVASLTPTPTLTLTRALFEN